MKNIFKNKEKIKQILLSVFAFLLILLGYVNYSLNDKTTEVASRDSINEVNLGDVELVSSEPVDEKDVYVSGIVPNEEIVENIISNYSTNVIENTVIEHSTNVTEKDNYFEDTRIQRDRMYSETIETYQKLIDSSETPEDQKAIAAQEISNITTKKNGIMIAENLIKNKGFENVVILENNGNVNVIVKSTNLNQEEISKIQNIVQRELNVDATNINISSK